MRGADAAEVNVVRATPPPPPWFLRRPRVARLLDDASDANVVVVRGPAGAGKTAAVADWVEHRPRGERVVWVALDRSVRTAQHLWDAVCSASAAAGLAISPARPAEIARACDAGGAPAWIAIDDVHQLPPCVAEEIAQAASLLAQTRLILLTRGASVLESLGYGVRLRIRVLAGEDLALTHDEAVALARFMPPPAGELSATRIRSLCSEVGGHPLLFRLGLQAAAGPVGASTAALAHWVQQIIGDDRLGVALRASVAGVSDRALATSLCGRPDAGEVLESLAADGLGGTDERGFFAFHGVVGAAVKAIASTRMPDVSLTHIRRASAEYLADRPGFSLAVFRLLAEASHYGRLWRYFLTHFSELIDEAEDVCSILDALPREELECSTAVVAIRVVVAGAPMSRVVAAGLADSLAGPVNGTGPAVAGPESEEALVDGVAAIAVLGAAGRCEQAADAAARWARDADTLDPASRLALRDALAVGRLIAAAALAVSGRLNEAERLLVSDGAAAAARVEQYRRVQWAFVCAMRGDMARADDIVQGLTSHVVWTPRWSALLAITRAAVLVEEGQACMARDLLRDTEPLCDAVDEWPYALIVAARAWIALSPHEGIEHVDRLLASCRARPIASRVRDLLDSAVADLALAAGDVRRACETVRNRTEEDVALRLTAARVGLITPDRRSLGDLARLVRRHDLWPRLRAQALLLLAVHAHRAGNAEDACTAMRRALALTRDVNVSLILSLVPAGELQQIAAEAGLALPGGTAAESRLDDVLSPVSFTSRERLVLTHLTSPLSLRAIAAAEYVSLSTVKSQAASVYRKLGATSRQQAVEIAYRRGILPLDA